MHRWRIKERLLEWEGCLVMGIVNASPDSFSDGDFLQNPSWMNLIRDWVDNGVSLIDIGGQSTRPGHEMVGAEMEWSRVEPILKVIRKEFPKLLVSVDTTHPAVARLAIADGADIVNDVSGLKHPEYPTIPATTGCGLIAMRSENCADLESLKEQFDLLLGDAYTCGVVHDQIVLDPGLGFGELPGADVETNLLLLDNAARLVRAPVMVGASRKRFVGTMSSQPNPKLRDEVSIQLAVRAARTGVAIVRVHDVKGTISALKDEGLLGIIRV